MDIFEFILMFDRFLKPTEYLEEAWLIYFKKDLPIELARKFIEQNSYRCSYILDQLFLDYWSSTIPQGAYFVKTIELDWLIAIDPKYIEFYDLDGYPTYNIAEMESFKILEDVREYQLDYFLMFLDFIGENWIRHSDDFLKYYRRRKPDTGTFPSGPKFHRVGDRQIKLDKNYL